MGTMMLENADANTTLYGILALMQRHRHSLHRHGLSWYLLPRDNVCCCTTRRLVNDSTEKSICRFRETPPYVNVRAHFLLWTVDNSICDKKQFWPVQSFDRVVKTVSHAVLVTLHNFPFPAQRSALLCRYILQMSVQDSPHKKFINVHWLKFTLKMRYKRVSMFSNTYFYERIRTRSTSFVLFTSNLRTSLSAQQLL